MDDKQKQIVELKTKITNLESELQAAKRALFELDEKPASDTTGEAASGNIIEGTFNGENMVGPDSKIYPVPANYASKSKLVEGDRLKLTINPDGSFLFKQIGPVERKHLTGELQFVDNAYSVKTSDGTFHVLYASVTYHKAKPGDNVGIIAPADPNAKWCVLESVLGDVLPPKVAVDNEQSPPDVQSETPVTDIHLAPNYEDKKKEGGELNISDMTIIGAKDNTAPEAVNPQSPPQIEVVPASNNQDKTTNDRAESISELEI